MHARSLVFQQANTIMAVNAIVFLLCVAVRYIAGLLGEFLLLGATVNCVKNVMFPKRPFQFFTIAQL